MTSRANTSLSILTLFCSKQSIVNFKNIFQQNHNISEAFLNKITRGHTDPSLNDLANFSKAASPQSSSIQNKSKISSPRSFTKSRSMTNSTHQPHNEIFVNLNPELCCRALEYIITLLASQSLLRLKDPNMSMREKQLIRRDLFPELSLFYDFVRKNVLLENKDHLMRVKYGIVNMKMRIDDDDYDELNEDFSQPQTGSHKRSLSNNSMRVNVIRKQHLSQQKPMLSTGLARSSIKAYNKQYTVGAETSTPVERTTTKRIMFDLDREKSRDEDIEYFNDKEDMKYANQSFVQLVERDYFHIIGIIFSTLHIDD